MDRIRIFFQQAWLYYKGSHAEFDIETLLLYRISIPLLTLIYYCVIAQTTFRTQYLASWVIGNSLLQCNNTCLFTLGGSFEGERAYGRLKWLLVSPYSRLLTVLEKGFLSVFESFATVIMCLFFGSLIFGISFAGVDISLFVVTVLAGAFAACCFGLFISMFSLLSNSMNLIINLIYTAMLILCGANFPISDLPSFAQFIAKLLPFTRSIEAGNMLYSSAGWNDIAGLLAQEICVGVAYLILTALLFRFIEKAAIRKASFEIF